MNMLPSSHRFDIDAMRRRLGGDDILIAELIGLFVEDYPAQLSAIEASIAARRLDAVRRDAHALKGSASNLSASGVIQAASELERMAERGEAAGLDQQFGKLVIEVEQLADELRAAPPTRL